MRNEKGRCPLWEHLPFGLLVGLLLGEPLVFQDVDRGGEGFASYREADHVGAGVEEGALGGATAEAASAEASAAGGEGNQRGLFG